MRALCGAIITAGALLGIGLTAVGIGERYARSYDPPAAAGQQPGEANRVLLSEMDRPLVFCLVFLTGSAVIGMGVTFVGLAYHQIRREREYLLEKGRLGSRSAV